MRPGGYTGQAPSQRLFISRHPEEQHGQTRRLFTGPDGQDRGGYTINREPNPILRGLGIDVYDINQLPGDVAGLGKKAIGLFR